MDRIAPTRRPDESTVGAQTWQDLLFVHWPIPVEALRPLVPESLTLDLYDGVAYVGVVPFAMKGVRPWWIPKAMAFNFLETNLRTYVHFKGEQPGVYFFSLEAASWLAVQAARIGWHLPYHYAKMSMQKKEGQVVAYESIRQDRKKTRHYAHYRIGDAIGPHDPESIEFFFLERYLLYTEHNGKLSRGQVHHVPYPTHEVELFDIEDGLVEAAGLPAPQGPPAFVHYSPGVEVDIFGLHHVPT